MAIGVLHTFPGGTKAQYDAVTAALGVGPGSMPAGETFHAAGETADGFVIFAIDDSMESWVAFRDGILMPKLQQGIEGGFPSPPEETIIELHQVIQ